MNRKSISKINDKKIKIIKILFNNLTKKICKKTNKLQIIPNNYESVKCLNNKLLYILKIKKLIFKINYFIDHKKKHYYRVLIKINLNFHKEIKQIE